MRVALHCAFYPLFQTDHWSVAQILFGPITVVIMVCSSQRHSHRGKSGFEGHYRAKDQGEKPKQQGQSIHQRVREMESGGSVSKSHQHFRHKVPESNRLVIGDMVRLKEEIKDLVNCFKNPNSDLNTRLTDFFYPYFSTYGGICSQMFSSQDVTVNYILHKGKIH